MACGAAYNGKVKVKNVLDEGAEVRQHFSSLFAGAHNGR
jgi:hypothetical protein